MTTNRTIDLPQPAYSGGVSVEEALNQRRSVREYTERPLSLNEASQLLWACAGTSAVTGATRTYPSAGGLYPLEFYLVAGNVQEVTPGVYLYTQTGHSLQPVKHGDFRKELAHAALGQRWIAQAPACLVIAAVYRKTTRVYGERGRVRYVHMDAGHSAQNIYLEAAALGLGTVAIGAFNDEMVKQVLGLTRAEPLYLFPVGEPGE
ncbi:MAG: SagB/ThcOx family dehydrogenase [Spirochaetota bacterium]